MSHNVMRAHGKQPYIFDKVQYAEPVKPVREMRGEYIGPRPQLKGKKAHIVFGKNGARECSVQFDDLNLPHHLTHGRTIFPIADFHILTD